MFYVLCSPAQAGALGLQVKPAQLDLSLKAHQEASERLTIFNPSTEVSIFEVFLESFEAQIKTSPSSFILEAGESREVSILLDFSDTGFFETNVAVVSRALSKNSLNAAGGLKIPLKVQVAEGQSGLANVLSLLGSPKILILLLILFILGAVVFFFRAKILSKPKV